MVDEVVNNLRVYEINESSDGVPGGLESFEEAQKSTVCVKMLREKPKVDNGTYNLNSLTAATPMFLCWYARTRYEYRQVDNVTMHENEIHFAVVPMRWYLCQ